MKSPNNTALPFFAYGIFRPGQLAFFQIKDLVLDVSEHAECQGTLLLRDGLPIIDPEGRDRVKGALITFVPGRATEAYGRIAAMEPEKVYRWQESKVEGMPANVLVGRSPQKGSSPCETGVWDGWDDPLFVEALALAEEASSLPPYFDMNFQTLFRLQMAYLLLWSSIERYVSLRYNLGDQVIDKLRQLAGEEAISKGLEEHVENSRDVYRATDPGDKASLKRKDPVKSILYYYQVRSNIAHRGKMAIRDYELLHEALIQLLAIFRGVLKAAKQDAASY